MKRPPTGGVTPARSTRCCKDLSMGNKPKFWYLRRRRVASDVDEELRLHLEMRVEELIAAGMPAGRSQARGIAAVRRSRSDTPLLPSTGRNTGDSRAAHLDVRGFHAGRADRHAQLDARPDADADHRRDRRHRHRRHRGHLQRHRRRDAAGRCRTRNRIASSASTPTRRRSSFGFPPSTTWPSRNNRRDSNIRRPTPIAPSASATARSPRCCARAWCRGASFRCWVCGR